MEHRKNERHLIELVLVNNKQSVHKKNAILRDRSPLAGVDQSVRGDLSLRDCIDLTITLRSVRLVRLTLHKSERNRAHPGDGRVEGRPTTNGTTPS
jgi:hypothetical protein